MPEIRTAGTEITQTGDQFSLVHPLPGGAPVHNLVQKLAVFQWTPPAWVVCFHFCFSSHSATFQTVHAYVETILLFLGLFNETV
jgi:hypothetical protein